MSWRSLLETLVLTLAAFVGALVLFCLVILAYSAVAMPKLVMPGELLDALLTGGFGSSRAWLNAMTKAAPLILTALCTALPARLGLIIIGGEGAMIAGGLTAAVVGLLLPGLPFPLPQLGMILTGMAAGAVIIGMAGVLQHVRGVNATISSLLLYYIMLGVFSFLVEGPLRDPATTTKFSTPVLPASATIGATMFGLDVHWGLCFGVLACLGCYVLMDHTTFGFAARMAGGNVRAARGAGLPVGRLILTTCLLGGAAAGLAGVVEVAVNHKQANESLYASHYGFTGILVAFIARQHPLGIIPVALLFGGLKAASDKLQYRLNLPDASVDVLMGIVFILILSVETLYGRFKVFQPREVHADEPVQPGSIMKKETATVPAV